MTKDHNTCESLSSDLGSFSDFIPPPQKKKHLSAEILFVHTHKLTDDLGTKCASAEPISSSSLMCW